MLGGRWVNGKEVTVSDNQDPPDRAGGPATFDVGAIVREFYDRVLADGRLAPYFDGVPMTRLRAMQEEIFAGALEGRPTRAPSTVHAVHRHLDLGTRHVSWFFEHLADALRAEAVPEELVERLFDHLAPWGEEIAADGAFSG